MHKPEQLRPNYEFLSEMVEDRREPQLLTIVPSIAFRI